MKANEYLYDCRWIIKLDRVVGFPDEWEADMMRMIEKNRKDHSPSEQLVFGRMRRTAGGPCWDCHEVRFAKSVNLVDDESS
jgi:hypothetical protein